MAQAHIETICNFEASLKSRHSAITALGRLFLNPSSKPPKFSTEVEHLLAIVVDHRTPYPIRRSVTSLLQKLNPDIDDVTTTFLTNASSSNPCCDDIIPYVTYPPFHDLLSTTHTSVLSDFTRIVTSYLSAPPVADLNMALDALRSLSLLFPSPPSPSHINIIEEALAVAEKTLASNTTNKDVLSKAAIVIATFKRTLSIVSPPTTIIEKYSTTPMVAIALLRGFAATYHTDVVESYLSVLLSFYKTYSGFDVDVSTRFYALQGIELLLSRSTADVRPPFLEAAKDVLNTVVMVSWENVGKNINTVLGGLFETIVKILVASGDTLGRTTALTLKQPDHSKGKYKALEILLPHTGPHLLLSTDPNLISVLINTCTGFSDNCNIAADLMIKIMLHLKSKDDAATDWVTKCWATPVAKNLLSPSPRTRIRTAAFILAPLLKASGKQIGEAAAAFLCALNTAHESEDLPPTRDIFQFTPSHIYLWAILETIKIAKSHSKLACTSEKLNSTIAEFLPGETFTNALSHNFDDIRLAALTALTISPSKSIPISPSSLTLLYENLPFSFKSSSPNYLSTLCDLLSSILGRLPKEKQHGFLSFIVNTLITKNLYPSTVFDKETCALHIFNKFLTPPNKSGEFNTSVAVLPLLCSPKAFAAIFSRLDSEWDRARDLASVVMKKIIQLKPSPLPSKLVCPTTFSRALFLASSPRSRESDSGANLLFLLYISSTTPQTFVSELTSILVSRVDAMSEALMNINSAFDGQQLPLAHGLFLALKMIILASNQSADQLKKIFDSCISAINISLAVVAESKDPTDDDLAKGYAHADFESSHQLANANNVTLNVNGGCLGANTSFGGLEMDEEETKRRNGVQRIVVGSWLLAKEACGCLAVSSVAGNELVEAAGGLLIKTLTTLKHQGAAFAAAAALNKIALHCFKSPSLQRLPSTWMEGLLKEITQKTTVHQSTLRRSSGYAFGFLSMMKAECSCFPPTSPLPITTSTIQSLLNWSSPSASQYKTHANRLSLDLENITPIDDDLYDWKCRVHSMNILRLLLLDSTLSLQLGPYVGNAIVIALLGFGDGSWAVSNSATMVFAAAMLKVVDSDKNSTASERSLLSTSAAPAPSMSTADSGVGSGKGGKGKSSAAITPNQLFLTYPVLRPFLLAELKSSVGKGFGSSANMTIYSIMLLLSRLQPAQLDDEGVCQDFIPLALECLCSKEHKLRLMASRALPVIVDSASSEKCLAYVQQILLALPSIDIKHGALMGMTALLGSSLFSRERRMNDDENTIVAVCDLLSNPNNAGLASEGFEALRAMMASDNVRVRSAKKFLGFKFAQFTPAARATKAAARTLVSVGIRTRKVEIIEVALESSHDSKVAGVKCLKKVLSNTDELRGEDERVFWEKVGVVLKGVLKREVNNDDAYQPTVRRVSRCLVMLENDFNLRVGLGVADMEWLWKVSNMEHREVDNVIELVAIAGGVIGERFQEQLEHSGDTRTTSWRCRLSVSEALGRADGFTTQFLDLLQDEDVDVRKSASRGVGYDVVAEKSVVLCCEESGLSTREILHVMERKVRSVCEHLLEYFEGELEGLRGVIGGIDNLNLGGTRRIFEEEKAFMFSESMVGVQALAKMVQRKGGKKEEGGGEEKVVWEDDDLTKLLLKVLSLAKIDPVSFALAVSGSAIFGKFHCLSLYAILKGNIVGVGNEQELREVIKTVIRVEGIHEEIANVLKGLIGEGEEEGNKMDSVNKMLFLL